MSKLIGRLVKVVKSDEFMPAPAMGKKGMILTANVSQSHFPVVVDFGGFAHAYNPKELRYLNNRKVVLDEGQ